MEPLEDVIDRAKCAYSAYGETTRFKNFRGEDMPRWDDLPAAIQSAWINASTTAARWCRPENDGP